MTQPNMSLSGMRAWLQTEAFASYRTYRGSQTVSTVTRRTLRVLSDDAGTQSQEKVERYLARAVAAYREQGAGQSKHNGVARNVCGLRNWGYDPYYSFTD